MKTAIRTFKLVLLSAIFFSIASCKKNGFGGSSGVSGIVSHHGKPIPDATVYIKFNAKNFPGEDLSVYDGKVSSNVNGYFEITNFYQGDYYLYAIGSDPAISAPYTVKGGIGVSLGSKERKDQDIPVGEE